MKRILAIAALVAGAAPTAPLLAQEWPELRPALGRIETDLIRDGDTLLDLAYRHRLGFQAVVRLNPGIDPWIPVAGTIALLPTRLLLPRVEEVGLVVNVPEMRLFDFTAESGLEVFALAIGDEADPSILGEFRVGRKRRDPVWHVPASIRAENPSLPAEVPPGPDNPLGSRWITIGKTSYGIHGTNVRWSIGREATHGCLRLYEDEIERLYDRVPEGTRIQIVYQPWKWGRDGDQLLLEVHPDPYGIAPDRLHAFDQPRELGLLASIDFERAWIALDEARGVPVAVGTLPATPPTSRPSS